MRILRIAATGAVGLGAYAVAERHWYRLGHQRVELDGGNRSLNILQVSDTHLTARNGPLIRWLEALPQRMPFVPDIIAATGDFISGNEAIDPVLRLLNGLPAKLGRFYVLGSHDYYQPRFEGYFKYFTGSKEEVRPVPADTGRLRDGLEKAGWVSLMNSTELLDGPTGTIRLAGVDDPYLKRHRTEHIVRGEREALAVALVHTPDVVSEFLLAGFDLVLAGHTHGGQVRIPGIGALTTNCSLDVGLARGLHRVGAGWLHVSPGLGTGPYGPIRFNCRPEATLLEVTGF